MDLNKPKDLLTDSENLLVDKDLRQARPYGSPKKAWVEDGHVFLEGYDGEIISMTPEVAIQMGRTLSELGTDALINNVMDDSKTQAR